MRKKILKFILTSFLLITFCPVATVLADDLPSDIVEGINSAGKNTPLPAYSAGSTIDKGKRHPDSSYQSGAEELTSVVLYILDFLKYIIGAIAVIFIITSAIDLITAGYKIDEIINSRKEALQWIFVGLLVIFIADELVMNVVFGPEGEAFSDPDMAEDYAVAGAEQIRGAYNFIEIFITYIAVLMIIISGMRLIVQAYDDESVKQAQKHIMWALGGLVMIGLSEVIIDIVWPYFPEEKALPEYQGESFFINVDLAFYVISKITQFAASFIAIIAIAAIVYAGYLYVLYLGQDDMVEKAKKIIKNAVISILVAAGAYALVNTLTSLVAREEITEMDIPNLFINIFKI